MPNLISRTFAGIICILALNAPVLYAADYRILAIRVDFPYEDPDHDTTSGRGAFDLRDYATDSTAREEYGNPWDVPPHDRTYFEYHLQALAGYWNTVSDGRINLSWDILPYEKDRAYTLSQKFYKYGNGRSEQQTYEKLAGLVHEAVAAAESADGASIDFSSYDTIMIIHAGIGSETSGMLNDIPSAYLSRKDFIDYLGADLTPDGAILEHAIVVPEMTSNTGYGGLNGILAQMFGFRLGLPSLSNNIEGQPAAGGWALMDIGAMAWGRQTLGFIPTHPCMWSKIELGLVDPVIVAADTTLDIAVTHISNGMPRALKIPITGDEYLLIENRFSPTTHDSLPPGIVFSGPDSTGVWLSVPHYDAFIPGSGVLVWHINDAVINAHRDDNTINDDPFRRGVDLLEADGRQDIGAAFSFGDNRAEYSIGHEDDTYKSNDVSTITPSTNPNTGSIWGGTSGITITVNSIPGEVMNVTVSFAGALDGFPVSLPGAQHLTAADLDGDGADELVVSNTDSFFVVSSNGIASNAMWTTRHPCLTTEVPDVTASLYNGFSYSSYHEHLLSDVYLFLPPDNVTPTFYDGPLLSISDDDNLFAVSNVRSYTSANTFSRNWYGHFPTSSGEPFRYVSIPDSNRIVSIAGIKEYFAFLNTERKLARGSFGETAVMIDTHASVATGPLLLDIDRDDEYETVITTGRELRIYEPDGSYSSTSLPYDPVGDPAAADLDNDGYPEIVLCTRSLLFAYRAQCAVQLGFPHALPPGDDTETITSSPVIVDLDGDGDLDIAFATSNQRLIAYDADGLMTAGFPHTVPGLATESPCVFRHDASGTLSIAVLTTDGVLAAYDLNTEYSAGPYQWPMWKGGPELSGSFPTERIAVPVATTADFEAFCYPNPVTGGIATFRITPSGETDCTITLYTLDGRKVSETHRSVSEMLPGVANDVRIDSSSLASGLYLARIATRQKTITYKVGVLK